MPRHAGTLHDSMVHVGDLGQHLHPSDAGWVVVLYLWLLVRTLSASAPTRNMEWCLNAAAVCITAHPTMFVCMYVTHNVCIYVPLFMHEQVARAVAIGVLYPLLCTGRVGYAMTWKTAVVMSWVGLRGAVRFSIQCL